jgi:hypothetical protein
MSLRGPSKTIVVEPLKLPVQEPQPVTPAKEPQPAKA